MAITVTGTPTGNRETTDPTDSTQTLQLQDLLTKLGNLFLVIPLVTVTTTKYMGTQRPNVSTQTANPDIHTADRAATATPGMVPPIPITQTVTAGKLC